MKKILFLFFGIIALVSCKQKGPDPKDVALIQQRDSLNRIIAMKDNEINDMMSTMNDIVEGFRVINEAEDRLTVIRSDEGASSTERIRENMQFIQQTMQQNRELINKLRNQLRQSSMNGEQLRRSIDNFTRQMEEKDVQLKQLQADLVAKDVQIGDLHLYNVEAVVVDGQNAPLLMGQSALKKLGSYEINGSMLIIHNDGEDNLDDQIENLKNLASESFRYNMYNKAADYYAQLYSMDELWGQELMTYAYCLQRIKEYETALEVLFSITDYDWYIENDIDFYWYIANVYFDAGDYNSAIEYYRLSNKYFSNSPLTSVAHNLYDIAYCYNLCDLFGLAKKAYWESFVAYCEKANANANLIWEECWKPIPKNGKSLRKDIPMLDDIVFNYVMNQYFNKEFSHYELNNKLKTLSDCGNKRAREHLSY